MILYLKRIIKPSTLLVILSVVLFSSLMLSFSFNILNSLRYTTIRSLTIKNKIITIYSGTAISPITGLIREEEVATLKTYAEGDYIMESEVIAPSMVGETPIIVRGVEFNKLKEFFDFDILKGRIPPSDGAVAGYSIAKRLNLNLGEIIWVRSLFNGMPYPLKIEGIAKFDSSFDDELLVPLSLGQAVRGCGTSVTLIRMRFSGSSDISQIISKLGGDDRVSTMRRWLIEVMISRPNLYNVTLSPNQLLEAYISKIGIYGQAVMLLSMSLIVVGSFSSFSAGIVTIRYHARSIRVILEIGVNIWSLWFRIALLTIIHVASIAVVGSLISYAVLAMLAGVGFIALFYTPVIKPQIVVPTLVVITSYLVGLLGGLREIK